MGLGPLNQNRLAQESTDEQKVVFPDNVPKRIAVEVGESMSGSGSSSRTQRRTLKLITRIGRQPITILVDSGLMGNYINACVYALAMMKVDKEDQPEELKMADSSIVKTEGLVQI